MNSFCRPIHLFVAIIIAAYLLPRADLAAAELPAYDRVSVISQSRTISDATLVDVNGMPFSLSSLRGRVMLAFFGFTNCPDVCPMAMGTLTALDRSGRIDSDDVAIVMISVDGERDTPDVMKEFLSAFSENIIGLTGNPQIVKPIAREFRAAFYKGSTTGDTGKYSVSHSPQVFVIDPSGNLRAEFYSASIDAMVGIVDALLAESVGAP